VPLNAPLPTAWNFPFQFEAGIQSSILMSESLDGFSVAAIRQNACGTAAPRPAPPGGTNAPASIAWASVIVALGSASDASPSHDVTALSGSAWTSTARRSAHKPRAISLMTAPLVVGHWSLVVRRSSLVVGRWSLV